MSKRLLTLLSLWLLGVQAGATPVNQTPVEVSLGNEIARARYVWLDYGQVVKDSTKTIELSIRNVVRKRIALDAFSSTSLVRAQWLDDAHTILPHSHIVLSPGEQRVLRIEAYFQDTNSDPKIVTLASSGQELVELVGKELIRPKARILQRVEGPPPPGVFWFSAQGEWWSGWYTLSLGKAEPGYHLDPATVRFNVQQVRGEPHPRSCGAWTKCELVEADDNDVSARFSVQGHHEGRWDGDINTIVRFRAWLTAEYILEQSLHLSAFDDALLRAMGVEEKQKRPGANSKSPFLAMGFMSLAGGALSKPDVDRAATTVPSLSEAQPKLYGACQKASGIACVELGVWTQESTRPEGPQEAEQLYKRACTLHYGAGCTQLGLTHLVNSSESQPDPQAIGELQNGCGLHDGLGCYTLGRIYQQGGSKGANAAAAQRFFAKACNEHFPAPPCERKPKSAPQGMSLSR